MCCALLFHSNNSTVAAPFGSLPPGWFVGSDQDDSEEDEEEEDEEEEEGSVGRKSKVRQYCVVLRIHHCFRYRNSAVPMLSLDLVQH